MYDDINYYYIMLAESNKKLNEIGELGKALIAMNYQFPDFPNIMTPAESKVYSVIAEYMVAETGKQFALDKIEKLTNPQYDTNFDAVDDASFDEWNF